MHRAGALAAGEKAFRRMDIDDRAELVAAGDEALPVAGARRP
jgi:hypothetical protein